MPPAEVVLTLVAKTDLVRRGEPVTRGVPFPKGMLKDSSDLRLFDESDQVVPLQAEVLDRWSDGSARWVLCDWQAEFPKNQKYRLRSDSSFPNPNFDTLPERPDWESELKSVSLQLESNLATDSIGMVWTPGVFASLREQCLVRQYYSVSTVGIDLRCHRFARSRVLRFEHTLWNSLPAQHPGGCWDLGNLESLHFHRCAVQFLLPEIEIAFCSPQVGSEFNPIRLGSRLFQGSSDGVNWRSTNHLDARRSLQSLSPGCQSSDPAFAGSSRAEPIVVVHSGKASLAVSCPQFWQNFPKGISATSRGLDLELFPNIEGFQHELQGGEQKTHIFYVAFGKDTITDSPLEWTRDPLTVVVDPEWIASTKAIPFLTPRSQDVHRDYLNFVDSAIEGDDSFEKKREIIDEYGWRHFGDIYGDHEAVLHTDFPPNPRVSHYNNQYDAIAGFGYQFLRSGDPRWLSQMTELAQHVIDIDIYHTDLDKSAYNHGLFWHTYHYVDADTGTHRSYPKRGKVPPHGKPVPGGGPSNEQNYASGLMLHYFLTGDLASKEAAIGLAQWVIDMDDGNKTVFRWLCRSYTGLASQSRSPDYHGPGRGSANSLSVLLDGHRLSGDQKFLDKAEQIIRRVIHPDDDVKARNLLDAENRWFYTMFLQALGKYLDYQAERGDLGFMYAYARESLLHYARWMLRHEYPYLQRKDLLEYPTETWAAQDLRKGEIFHFASMHATGDERESFRRAARFFFHVPLTQLSTMPTRSLCRPVVLLLSHGWMHNYFRLNPDEVRPAPTGKHDFGSPEKFVPQKETAKKRAKLLAGAMAVVLAIGMLWLVFR